MWGQHLLLLLLLTWGLSTADFGVSDYRTVGPYVVDLETFSPCDKKGSILVTFDVKKVCKDDRCVYEGNLTIPYDVDREELLTTITYDQWSETSGWQQYYLLERYDIMQFMIDNFPTVFESTFGALGINGKPMPSGTYHLQNFKPTGLKIDHYPVLPYGPYRVMATQSLKGTELSCLQFKVNVKETPSTKAGIVKKGKLLFG